MGSFIPFSQRRGFVACSRVIALALIVFIAFASQTTLADPGDFAAMPGLWKIVTTPVDHGHRGAPVTTWHCVDEGADPWAMFAVINLPAYDPCERSSQHRGSTALSWSETCGDKQSLAGKGQVDFDSAEHYTASITLQDRGEVVKVEGQRYAACTSPSD